MNKLSGAAHRKASVPRDLAGIEAECQWVRPHSDFRVCSAQRCDFRFATSNYLCRKPTGSLSRLYHYYPICHRPDFLTPRYESTSWPMYRIWLLTGTPKVSIYLGITLMLWQSNINTCECQVSRSNLFSTTSLVEFDIFFHVPSPSDSLWQVLCLDASPDVA